MAERRGFEPRRPFYQSTRFPIVLLRPTRTPLQTIQNTIIRLPKKQIKGASTIKNKEFRITLNLAKKTKFILVKI